VTVQDPIGPIEIIATNAHFFDEAIDMDDPEGEGPSAEERLAEYRKTRDLGCLVQKPGKEFTRFVCKPIPAAFERAVLRGVGESVRYGFAVLAGCHLVKLPDGSEMRPGKLKPYSYGTQAPDEKEWIGALTRKFGSATIDEVGAVICERARLPEGARGPFPFAGLDRV
jgi:hypothetical protein